MSANNTVPPTAANSSAPVTAAPSSVPAPIATASNSSVPVPNATASNNSVPTAGIATSNSAGQAQGTGEQNPAPLIAGESAGQSQQEPNLLLRPQPVQPRQLGLRQFFNNKKLSDVIIRFGDDGQKTFYAHKVVLASVSVWFHAAFTNSNFIEAESGELTLQGDDDDALLSMLQACYLPNNRYPHMPPWTPERFAAAKGTNEYLFFHISVYTVVDKYQAPKIREHVLFLFRTWMRGVLSVIATRGAVPQMLTLIGLRSIVEKVYEITAHVKMNDPLRKTLLDVIMEHSVTKPINVRPGVLAGEVVKVARDHPEFGRDMFLRTMQAAPVVPNTNPFLAYVDQVTCQHCGQTWIKLLAYSQAQCILCGQ